MKTRSSLACVAAALSLCAGAASAGMYDQPYGQVESGDAAPAREEARVAVTKIDGKSVRSTRSSDPLEPGKHLVTVHFDSARGLFRPEYIEFDLNVEACTRYRIVAKYEMPTGGDWKPRVYTEPIGECVRKFNKDEPKK